MIKVSVIIPVYNCEKYISRAIESVLSQTLKDIEIILIDDGSNDDSVKICDEYAKKKDNIKVLHKKNEGAGMARNDGLKMAEGEFVAFLDSDDYLDSCMYEVLYNKAIKEKAQACFCGNNKVIDGNIIADGNIKDRVFDRKKILKKTIPYVLDGEKKTIEGAIAVWHGIYSLKLIKKYKLSFLNERVFMSEDTIFNLEFFGYAYRIVFVKENLHYQCIIPKSLSRDYSNYSLKPIRAFYYYILQYINSHKDIDQEICLNILRKRCLCQYKIELLKKAKSKEKIQSINKAVEELLNDKLLQDILKHKKSFIHFLNIKDKIFLFACENDKFMIFMIKLIKFKN